MTEQHTIDFNSEDLELIKKIALKFAISEALALQFVLNQGFSFCILTTSQPEDREKYIQGFINSMASQIAVYIGQNRTMNAGVLDQSKTKKYFAYSGWV